MCPNVSVHRRKVFWNHLIHLEVWNTAEYVLQKIYCSGILGFCMSLEECSYKTETKIVDLDDTVKAA